MPASIIIGVESNHQTRYSETQLPVNDSTTFGLLNESFIFDELVPFAQTRLKASPFTVLIGHSRYGYFTTYLLTRHYMELNAVISASPFLTELHVNLVDSVMLLYDLKMPHKVYYRFGIGNDYPEDFHLMKKSLHELEGSNKQLNIKGTLFEEAGHNTTPGLTVGSALYDVFSYWSHQQNAYINNSNKSLDTLSLLLNDIQLHYGHSIPFSLGTLNGKGWYFYNEKDYTNAIEAWTIMLDKYPNFCEGYLYIIYAQQELKQDFSQTLDLLIASIAPSDFYKKEEKEELWAEIKKLQK